MSGNIYLSRNEMDNVHRNLAHPSQCTIDGRRMFFDEIASINISRRPDGDAINAPFVDFHGLEEALSRQKQCTSAIEIGKINIGKKTQGIFLKGKIVETNSTWIVNAKPDHDKLPFSTEESTILAA